MKNINLVEKNEIIMNETVDHREAYDEYEIIPDNDDREDMYDWELRKEASPFIDDYHTLSPTRFEAIQSDLFERHTISDKYGIKSDQEYDDEIMADMLEATPDWTSQDMDQEKTVDMRITTNLEKIIWRECQKSGYGIKKLELSNQGDCKIPSHLRPEEIAKYTRISNQQWEGQNDGKSEAEIIAKMYRIIEADFETVLKLNKAIKDSGCMNPWDTEINDDGLTLKEFAESMKEVALEIEPAETVEAKAVVVKTFGDLNQVLPIQVDQVDYNINEDIARFVPADWEPPKQEFIQSNQVDLFTYHTISKIPKSKHLTYEESSRTMSKCLAFLEENTFKAETLERLGEWAYETLDWDQQAEYDKTVNRIMQQRARDAA